MPYVVVVNTANNVATIHRDSCADLGSEPLRQTASAERLLVPDGLDALMVAARAAKRHTSICGHCLGDVARVVAFKT